MRRVGERTSAKLVGDIVRATAKAYGVPLVDTSALTIADASLWLPRDGRFSLTARARRMAQLLAEYLRQRR